MHDLPKPKPLKYGQKVWEIEQRKIKATRDLLKTAPKRLKKIYKKLKGLEC